MKVTSPPAWPVAELLVLVKTGLAWTGVMVAEAWTTGKALPPVGVAKLVKVARLTWAAVAVAGAERVDDNADPVTGGEDFSLMLQAKPGAFMFMGIGAGGPSSEGLHTPTYDFNDDAIPLGVQYWLSLVRQELGSVGE